MSGAIPIAVRQRAVTDPLVGELVEAVEAAHAEALRYKSAVQQIQKWGMGLPKPLQNELFALVGRPA